MNVLSNVLCLHLTGGTCGLASTSAILCVLSPTKQFRLEIKRCDGWGVSMTLESQIPHSEIILTGYRPFVLSPSVCLLTRMDLPDSASLSGGLRGEIKQKKRRNKLNE